MEAILAHFSAAELRVKCVTAVYVELQRAEKQLQPALDALKHAISVVQTSRKMYTDPLALVDESPDISKALELLVAACNEIGVLICELNRQVSSAGSEDMSPSATDDEEEMTAEPKKKKETETVERKKAAKETAEIHTNIPESITIIDLLSDEEKEQIKNEKNSKSETQETVELPMPPVHNDDATAIVEPVVEDEQNILSTRKSRKRKAQRNKAPPLSKRAQGVVVRLEKRAEMAPTGPVGTAVCTALDAAIGVERSSGNSCVEAFVAATAEAGRKLVEVHEEHPVQAERHLEDMRLLMSVAVDNLKGDLAAGEVKMSWKMLKILLQLHEIYPVKTKGLHRNCLQLQKFLVKEHVVPTDVVTEFKAKLDKLFVEVDEWIPLDGLTTRWFDKHMNLVNELIEGRFEGWNPRTEPILGKTVSNLERICGFGVSDAWNDRYTSICLACSKMSRSTFFWTVDLSSESTTVLIRDNRLEPGFGDEDRVKKDFEYVMSYAQEVRRVSEPTEKKSAFEELVDRLRWIFNAVAMTKNQSLLPLARLKRLNECFCTLVRLCDNGDALNLEGCIHLERLLVVMRQVMYIRVDYVSVSKRATDSLLSLFPHDKRTRFVYPDGSGHAP
ncbi:hypothetical protein, variant 1 [Phytophthora nicotianae INRA-310]|uniref:Uncharacterized protein n=1 Tax=Phytophthora nicotianae (strain INRA-310) TaxID=761204 RepID=W2QFV2_PHYN3